METVIKLNRISTVTTLGLLLLVCVKVARISAQVEQSTQPQPSASALVSSVVPATLPPLEGSEASEGGEGGEGGEGATGAEGAEGAEGTEAPEGAEGAGGEGGEGGEGAEGTEAPEEDEAEGEAGGVEAFQEKLEDLIEYYRREGMTASIQALMTRFPDVNMTDILIEDLGEAAEGQEGSENMIQGSEQGFVDGGKAGKYAVMQSIVPNMYADYEVFVDGKPLSSKARYSPQQPGTGINPTRVSAPGSPNTLAQGGQAQLVAGSNPGPFSPGRQVSRHSTGMTASATFGVVVGTVLLSWLIVGPAVCVAWRWNERRREGKKILLQRADRGSVDEGIMDAMVMSELGKQSHKKGARRQTEDDVEASLARNRSELQSFPTTTTLESQVM